MILLTDEILRPEKATCLPFSASQPFLSLLFRPRSAANELGGLGNAWSWSCKLRTPRAAQAQSPRTGVGCSEKAPRLGAVGGWWWLSRKGLFLFLPPVRAAGRPE